MRRITMISTLMLLLVSPLLADCSTSEKKALEAFDRAWGESSTKGDRAALEQIYAADYMNMAAGNTQNRAQAIESAMRDAEKARANPQPAAIHDYYMINCTPNTATITHRNVATTTVDGHSKTSYSRSVHVVEKRNGKWQVVSNAGNPLSDDAQIMYFEHEWNDADMKSDSSWFARNFASDMTNISSRTGKITSKIEEMADLKTRKGAVTWAELSDLNTRKVGDTIVATGINHVKGTDDDGKAYDRRVAFTDVWVKRDDRWQVLATQGTEVK